MCWQCLASFQTGSMSLPEEYLVTQTKELIVSAGSAAEARKKAEDVFYVRPGFDKTLHRSIRVTGIKVEKRRD